MNLQQYKNSEAKLSGCQKKKFSVNPIIILLILQICLQLPIININYQMDNIFV